MWADQRHQLFRIQIVDTQVPGQVTTVVVHQVRSIMQQWPQRAIGEAVIEVGMVAVRQVDGGVLHHTVLQPVHFAAGVSRYLAAPAKPQPATFLQRRAHG
jgi:hypothetical protein